MADVTVEFGATDVGLEKTLKAVQDEMTSLQTKVNSGELSISELETTIKRLSQLDKLQNNIKDIGDASTQSKPKIDELNKEIVKTGTDAQDAGGKAEIGFGKIAIGAGIAGAAAKAGALVIDAAFAAVQKTIQSFGDALDMGGRLADLSERTGIASGNLLVLERAFTNTGMAAEDVGPLINKMQKAIVEAGDGTSAAADAFTKLGIPLSALKGLSPDEQFKLLGEAISRIPDPAERAAVSMEVFGRSGGKLNQLFGNMSEEIKTASQQLGSMTEIMDRNSNGFDAISDNVAVVKGKFVEFAAGLLDKVQPALEAITSAMTRFDAAGFGQNLAESIMGGTQSMKGFEAAINAIKTGDLGTAFELVFTSIKVQVKETGNNIYQTFVASFKAAAEFITDIFDPKGMLMSYISGGFKVLGGSIAAAIADSLAAGLPDDFIFGGLKKSMSSFAASAKEESAALFGAMYHDSDYLKESLKGAASAFPENFKKSYDETKPLFDVSEDLQKIEELANKGTVAIDGMTDAERAAAKEAEYYYQEYMKGEAAAEQARNKAEASLKKQTEAERDALATKRTSLETELLLKEAKISGNKNIVQAVEHQRAYNKYLEEAKKLMPIEEAEAFAKRMAQAEAPARTIRDQLADIAQQKIDQPILSFREQNQKLRQDLKDLAGYLGGDFSNLNIMDLAKKMGIDTFRKDSDQVFSDIKKKIEEIKDTPIDIEGKINKESIDKSLADLKLQTENTFKGGDAKATGGEGGEGGEGGQGGEATVPEQVDEKTALNQLMNGVDEIKRLIYQIEPKLPVAALI